ncbi:unnamed protein product [Taenia asiatica]|uniref:SCP domain-containing protein n=1 Tax=Taenia asiatica TaxID=60517 RepID=A0A0R3VXD6_TAEAS|nr:unnamed protein product [Taenia asiatica]
MSKFICALVLITLVAAEPLTEQERKALLHLHNNKRAAVKPSPTNMLQMVYSKELEKLAAEWVAKCIYEHPDVAKYPQYGNCGQNLAVSGGSGRNLVRMATGWWDEVHDYTYDTNTCAPGKVCGHYTQMVWAASEEVGCAVERCDSMKPDWPKPIFLLACQYKPPGNYVGAKPYTSGTSCSECPPGTACVNNLCSKGGDHAEAAMSTASITRAADVVVLFAVILAYHFG